LVSFDHGERPFFRLSIELEHRDHFSLLLQSPTMANPSSSLLLEQQQQQQRLEADQERYGVADCLAWTTLHDTFCFGGVPKIIQFFSDYCHTPQFIHHCAAMGFQNPSFVENSALLDAKYAGYAKFQTCLERELPPPSSSPGGSAAKKNKFAVDYNNNATSSSSSSTKENNHEDDDDNDLTRRCLGLVFHGTSPGNIGSILQYGLNAAKRNGQAYGPGEYFAKNPTTSISYCNFGRQLIVFVVVLPSQQKQQECVGNNNKPADYVVVANNCHHLAIGTLRFDSVDAQVMTASVAKRQALLQLSQEVMDKSQIKQEAETKALIMKHLIANKTDWASELYQRKVDFLGLTSKREIAWYVHSNVEADTIDYYFPDLPAPYKEDELEVMKVQSFDLAAKDEQEALDKMEHARKELFLDGHHGATLAAAPRTTALPGRPCF
jgi:Poly(ADP-ribose) polymerase catalytic domain